MVQVKNKNKFGAADSLHAKKTKAKFKNKTNPFGVHVNKQKFKLLGKRNKNERGLPGVSRARAIEKRKNTLGHELKLFHKSNTIVDKRIGEKSNAVSQEDKIVARFAAEKVQQHKTKLGKRSVYNLAEHEVLTHRGQTLEEIEKFDDPRSDDEDDEFGDKKFGNLRDDFVSDANFGGGMLSRGENVEGVMSRKDLIEQLIVESKKRKLEKQKLKEETLDLTQKLDTEWKDLHTIVSKDFNKEVESKPEKKSSISLIDKLLNDHNKKNEDYDKTMRELKFAPRGTPSDKLKNEDELAKQEKDKLEQLEKDRLDRMRGVKTSDVSFKKPKHRSADDLDDDYLMEDNSDFMIAYDKEGKLLVPLNNLEKKGDKSNADNDDDNDDDGDDNDGDDDDAEQESEESDESGNESDDSLNDLRKIENLSEDENVDKIPTIKTTISKLKQKSSPISDKTKANSNELKINKLETNNAIETDDATEKIKKDLSSRKLIMEQAAKELPYIYEMPNNYEELMDLLENQQPDYQFVIVERIIKCNHPSLGEKNKEKLGHLFAYLLQYLNDIFSNCNIEKEEDLSRAFKCLDRLVCHYYLLAQMDPSNAKTCIVEVVKEKYDDFKKTPKKMPDLNTLIFFKLVSVLFSTSDMKHPVVTPCVSFMSHILTECKIRNSTDIAKGLFIITLILEYTALSKRIVPAANNFMSGILSLYVPKIIANSKTNNIPPFNVTNQTKNAFVLSENASEIVLVNKNLPLSSLIWDSKSEELKIQILITTLNIFKSFFKLFNELHTQKVIFKHHIDTIDRLHKMKLSNNIVTVIESVKTLIKESYKSKSMKLLVEENKLPKMLKTYEPAFESNFTGKKKRIMSKEKGEHQRLLYRHKKEMKGALREIRRDKAFISSVKIKEKLRSDEMRKQKVKQIFSEASLQQGELNALQRSKKKKK